MKFKNYVCAVSILFFVVACSENESIEYYTGETGPAKLTEENALDIVHDAINADLFLYSFLDPLRLQKLSYRSAAEADQLLDGGKSGTAEGDCGGTVTYDVIAPLVLSKIEFSSFCVSVAGDQRILDGSIESDLSSDLSSTVTTIDMIVTEGEHVISTIGSMEFKFDEEFGVIYTMNLSSHDSDGDVSIKLVDFSFEGGVEPYAFSGRVYFSTYLGYVDITTPTKFTRASLDGPFESGKMVFEAGDASITIEAVGDGDCALSVDVEGDGTTESVDTDTCSSFIPSLE